MPEPAAPPPPRKASHYVAWHALVVHFPISLFGVAFLFHVLHFFVAYECFELATNTSLLVGAVAMVPSVITGWITWRSRYHGMRSAVILRKIYIGLAMLVLSSGVVIWRVGIVGIQNETSPPGHPVYTILVTLLILGAVLEGYYGGPLTHRRIANRAQQAQHTD
jgi:uncharacterized membrane protein